MQSIFKHLITQFFLCNILILNCQNNGELIEQTLDIYTPFTAIQYSSKNGLPQNQVTEIIAQENGNLILATANGIVSFNGYTFTPFPNEISNKEHRFRKLYWNSEHKTLTGVSLDNKFFSIYPRFFEITPNYINNQHACYAECKKDTFFIATFEGTFYAYVWGTKTLHQLAQIPPLHTFVLKKSGSCLFASSLDGLFKINIVNGEYKKISPEFFYRLELNPYTQELYGTTKSKLYKIDTGLVEIFDIHGSGPKEECRDFEFADTNTIFLGSTKGLYLVEPDYPEHFTKSEGLPSHYISSLYYNKAEDCLFIGTDEKGLLKLQLKHNYSFSTKQGFSESSLSSIIRTRDKKVLVAENCCNIYEVKPDTILTYSSVEGNYACLAEIDGVIYAGTWGDGVKLIKNKEQIGSITTPNIPNNFVHACFKDSKGNTWIGTSDGIAKGKNHRNFKPIAPNQIKGVIISFYELKNGAICIGGSNGVFIVNNDKLVKKIDKTDGLVAKEVRSFYEDDEGKLWIGTYDGGLFCFYNNTLTNINGMKGCMLDRDAFCMAKDTFGYFYITSNHGLWRVEEKDLSDFYHHKLEYLIPFHYDQENGILNPEFNGGFQNNYLRTPMDHFYFPTLEGIVLVSPEELKFRKLNPSIDRVFVNDTLSSLNQHIFNRSTSSIQFDFSCINYLSKYNVYFQHKLIGERNTEWSVPQKENTVHLKMLPPGKYTFMVRAVDGFNDKSPNISTFEFEIKPHLYETFYFKIIVLLFLISTLTIIIVYRVFTIRKKAEKRELAKRQLAEFELKAIQSQMSPHFIFNCLNSIKYFVISGQKENAEKFLDHFSLLIRKFLETSELVEVPILEEVSMLKEYLELEKMRMNNQIDFEIHLDPKHHYLKIPTMLTQPYVENAIKHGVGHLPSGGKISIRFKLIDQTLVCEIEDNGIGRKKGLEISERSRKHIPKGMGLVKEKSELLKELYKKNIVIEIFDKTDDHDHPLGTLITIKIPL